MAHDIRVGDISAEVMGDLTTRTERYADVTLEAMHEHALRQSHFNDAFLEVMADWPVRTERYTDVSMEAMHEHALRQSRYTNMFLEVMMAAPELSPQPVIPYFSLYFET